MRILKKGLGLLVGLGLLMGSLTALADADYDNALKSAPQGITLSQIFTPGETANNQAKVVSTTNPAITGTQAVMVTNAKNQFGTIWSTDDNAFDLKQDETVSMWMYFGNQKGNAADGMALVLQNDERKLAATPSFGKKISGETLGVWAVDTNTKQTVPAELAKTAIQNSWALEFDTHLNTASTYNKAGNADSFDAGLTGPHLAAGYPAQGATYQMIKTTTGWPVTLGTAYYAEQKHSGVIMGNESLLANGQWHHVTLNWDAQAQEMTYTFDDKDPASGHELAGTSRTVPVDPAVVDPQNTGQVRWGFTGATGSSYANNLVIFEGVPGLVDATANATLTNLSTNKVIHAGDTVMGKNKVELTYDLSYLGGKQDWKDVVAKLQLPANVTFASGKIVYGNGQEQTVDPTTATDQHLDVTLKEALSAQNKTAKLTLTGQVDDLKQAQEVDAQTSTFAAVNGVVTADTPHFTIAPKLDITLLLMQADTVNINAGETTTIKAQVFVPEGMTITNKDLLIYPTVNGQDKSPEPLDDPDDEASGRVRYTPAASDLHAGKNEVTLYVKDQYGNQSETVKVTINVTGGLEFADLSPLSTFETTTLTGKQQHVARTKDWKVRVLDTRAAGSQWSLQVAASDVTDEAGKPLAGQLVYYDGETETPLSATAVMVHQGTATADRDVTDVVADWDQQDTGIRLKVAGNALSGDYTGQLNWSLNDVPQ